MKVFFIASPRAKKEYKKEIQAVFDFVQVLGHTHVNDFVIKVSEDDHYKMTSDQQAEHYKTTMESIKKADIVIVDVTVVSLSMGYIIDRAKEYSKPVIIIYTAGKTPFFFSAIEDERVQIVEYTLESIKEVLKSAIDFTQEQMDTRFNFFISPKHQVYLDWVSKNRRIPRAVYLRRLIDKDMEKTPEFRQTD